MKSLNNVLMGLPLDITEADSIEVASITSDSRQVGKATLFIAVRGGSQDGHDFIPRAQEQGACAIVGEREKPAGLAIPYFQVKDSRQALARIAANFHGNPSHSMVTVGVTGTSGKTTTTYLIESILKSAGHRVGVIGTVNFRYGSKVLASTHTTPGPVELQRLLSEMKQEGCTAVIMEVSSHSLKQHRTAFIAFDGMVFTNLSPEHLDFHPDMEDYFRSKSLLFTDMVRYSVSVGKNPFGAINIDDEYGLRLGDELEERPYAGFRFGRFGMTGEKGSDLRVSLAGIEGEVDGIRVRSPLAGRFNAYNVLAALEVARGMGIGAEDISKGISALDSVPGRLERVPNSRGIHVFVDYAHKPDALDKVLRTLRPVRDGHRLITVFGCGGDRDRKKRPVMGRCAVELSDYVYITSDNPRTEDPGSIIAEILRGIPENFTNFQTQPDRKKAIVDAVKGAMPGDLVVIAGKGHENYQIIADPVRPGGTRKIHFDDREVALEALR